MWRTLVSGDQINEIVDQLEKRDESEDERVSTAFGGKKDELQFYPDNDHPASVHPLIARNLDYLDRRRDDHDLIHQEEGIMFVTYEVEGILRQSFKLSEFPFDAQSLDITVRLDRQKCDKLHRHIVPLCHDKAFFCSSRVPESTEWEIARNLNWKVERGAHGNDQLDGGRQRLVASITLLRKSYYYTQHYLVILFLMTTCAFSAFTVDPDNIETRSGIVFSLLLTVVAFNYSLTDIVPSVSYATVFEIYVNLNFVMVIVVGAAVFTFSWIHSNANRFYSPHVETGVGGAFFFVWMSANFSQWYRINSDQARFRHKLKEHDMLDWLVFSHKKKVTQGNDTLVLSPSPIFHLRTFFNSVKLFFSRQSASPGKKKKVQAPELQNRHKFQKRRRKSTLLSVPGTSPLMSRKTTRKGFADVHF